VDESSACAIPRPILEEGLPDELHFVGLCGFRPRDGCEFVVVDYVLSGQNLEAHS